jgi:hypothetical protein
LKDPKWQKAISQAMSDSDRDIPLLISMAAEMPPQQWDALLNTAKALPGVHTRPVPVSFFFWSRKKSP